MARIARVVAPDYPHHITQRGVRSIDIFRNDEERLDYLKFLSEEAERFGVKILAWCLMTNHIHLIAVPKDEKSLSQAIGEAHKRYTRMRNFSEGMKGYLFQGRFGSCVLDEKHLLRAVRYVERNPVRAGLVKEAWVYPWSSAGFHIGKKESDELVKEDKLGELITDWRGYLKSEDKEIAKQLRISTRTGRPVGDGKFLSRLKRLIGRDLRKRKPGRPRKDLENK